MQLTPQQTNELLEIIHTNQAIIIGTQFGDEFLSEYDRLLLKKVGLPHILYNQFQDSLYTSFHFGMLAQALHDTKAFNHLNYNQLKDYIKEGKYIPLTQLELNTITAIKQQTLSDIKGLNGRIFQDLTGVIQNNSREFQEKFIKQELEEGVKNQKTLRQISNDLHRKTGDWSRDFDRIVEYQANTAYQQGRASWLQKEYGDDVEVYKVVFTSACKHCIRLYLTNGFGSEPIVFKLSEIRGNGSNIGRKVAQWKATIDSTHPYCRCLLKHKRKGYSWNQETQQFDIPPKREQILKKPRKPIRVKIGGKELEV